MKALQFFLYIESGVTILVVVLIGNIESFSKDIIFNLADCTKTYIGEETAKSLKSCTNQKTNNITL